LIGFNKSRDVFPIEATIAKLAEIQHKDTRCLHLVDFGNHYPTGDPFAGLYEQPAADYIARRGKADLFVSVHSDAVNDRRATGASVYALSLKGASDEAAKQLAERENASVGGVSLDGKDDVLASVLIDLSQNASLSASLEVGNDVIKEMDKVTKMHRRTVQQAGFLVLKSPDMPSILVETAFISNPAEERRLADARYQARVAEAVFQGIRQYLLKHPPPPRSSRA